MLRMMIGPILSEMRTRAVGREPAHASHQSVVAVRDHGRSADIGTASTFGNLSAASRPATPAPDSGQWLALACCDCAGGRQGLADLRARTRPSTDGAGERGCLGIFQVPVPTRASVSACSGVMRRWVCRCGCRRRSRWLSPSSTASTILRQRRRSSRLRRLAAISSGPTRTRSSTWAPEPEHCGLGPCTAEISAASSYVVTLAGCPPSLPPGDVQDELKLTKEWQGHFPSQLRSGRWCSGPSHN
jgi:hypothetical protein